ncbi:acetylcholine receptor subunit alpha-like isoform X2 [Contarinia nasturtii]|uniref:acetylcholine receptor subunit alpha-like isoform X2 n=1 Tax=Contarinia nasturtii TaxID=265458 RepID=UPI0012D49E3A|nr:acetylcholine receptor subunit alpha-like isoform X2 [Contarinia nasturtii]
MNDGNEMKWFPRFFLLAISITVSGCNPDAKRLYDDLLSNYNKLVRPVVNVSDALTVRIKLKLSQLIDVNLKNQIMTTNLWVEQSWYDYKLKWEPREYGGVEMLHVPSDHIWRPDIVLYNNADGNFEVTLATKATLNYTGRVEWRPPAIYKSSCEIDVEYFPFDEQTCVMKFGSWTYDGFQVDLRHNDELNGTNVVEVGVDLTEFYQSVEWDILEVPAVRNEKFYTCCDEPYLDITFNITMRRKTLFYTVNLIIPCMGISFLTILVFYLPSDSGEKVSLSISILLSLTVFFLLLAEIIPPTSLVVPLLGKFVLFTMILDTVSICVTVLVLNVHFRSPQTHTMSPWVRAVFINHLPKLLVMRRPIYPYNGLGFSEASRRFMMRTCNGLELRDQIPPLPPEIALSNFDSSLLLDHHIMNVCERNMESFNMNVSCKLHGGSPKNQATNTISPVHRLHTLDLMDDIPLTYCKETSTNSPILTTPIMEHDKILTPRRQVNHQFNALNDNLSSNANSNQKSKSYGGNTSGSINGINTAYNTDGVFGTSSSASHSNFKSIHRSFSQQEQTNDDRCGLRHRWQACPELHKAMDGVNYIADHTRKEEESTKVKEDWKYVAMVLDRLFLWLFSIAVIVGTCGIILQAPTLYDTRVPIDIKMSEIASATVKPHVIQPIL